MLGRLMGRVAPSSQILVAVGDVRLRPTVVMVTVWLHQFVAVAIVGRNVGIGH